MAISPSSSVPAASHLHSVPSGLDFLPPASRELRILNRTFLLQLANSTFLNRYSFTLLNQKRPLASRWPFGQPVHAVGPDETSIPLEHALSDAHYDMYGIGMCLADGPEHSLVHEDFDTPDSSVRSGVLAVYTNEEPGPVFAIGRLSNQMPGGFLTPLDQDDCSVYSDLHKFTTPQTVTVDGVPLTIEIRRSHTLPIKKNVRVQQDPVFQDKHWDENRGAWVRSQQVGMPSTVYVNKVTGIYDDVLVIWARNTSLPAGWSPAESLAQALPLTPRRCKFKERLRLRFAAQLIFLIKPHWTEQNRHITARVVAGWLVREMLLARESEYAAYLPVSTMEDVDWVIRCICHALSDHEEWMRIRAGHDAYNKLDRNSEAVIAGIPAMAKLVGDKNMEALRRLLMPHIDHGESDYYLTNFIFSTHENRVYRLDASSEMGESMAFRTFQDSFANKFVKVQTIKGSTLIPVPKWWYTNPLRITTVGTVYDPAAKRGLVWYNKHGKIAADGDPNAYLCLNLRRDFPYAPEEGYKPDPQLARRCENFLRRHMWMLTSGNEHQMRHLIVHLAHFMQHPKDKPALHEILYGEQGIGKTFFADSYLGGILGDKINDAESRRLGERFTEMQVANKEAVVIDENRKTRALVEFLWKLIRKDTMQGEGKHINYFRYRTPRLLISLTNVPFSLSDGPATNDRAVYYTQGFNAARWNQKFKTNYTDEEFIKHLKGRVHWFYAGYLKFLERDDVRTYYTWRLLNFKYDVREILDTTHSSSADEDIASSGIKWENRFIGDVIEQGYIRHQDDYNKSIPREELREVIKSWAAGYGNPSTRGVPEIIPNEIIEHAVKVGFFARDTRARAPSLIHIGYQLDDARQFSERLGKSLNIWEKGTEDGRGKV